MRTILVILYIFVVGALIFNANRLLTKINTKVEAPKPAPVKKSTRLFPVVRLVQNGRTYCSGFVIDDRTIVTAGHCVLIQVNVLGAEVIRDNIEIRAYNNVSLDLFAKVKDVLPQLDRAVLKGDFRMFEPATAISNPAANTAARVEGAKFVSCGYPLGGELYCSTFIFKSNWGFMLAGKGVLIPGMSGGPTFNEKGEVLGVNVAVEGDMAIVSPIYNVDDER